MTTQTPQFTQDRTTDLYEYIASRRILDALYEFYAVNVVMQDALEPPWVGLAANIERQKAWLANLREWRGFEVRCIAVAGNVSFTETAIDFTTQDRTEVHVERVARAIWEDGKIVIERLYPA